MSWERVKWSEAGQVLDQMQASEEGRGADAGAPPEAYFARLRAEGRRAEAADFLAQALPRLEAVAWAARTVRDVRPQGPASRPEARALRSALFFVQDPTEARRRAAYEAAQACPGAGPEALAAYAAFFSGGSMSPAEQTAVLPPRHVAGRCAAGAVKSAALPADKTGAALDAALDAGAALAREGLGAGA